MKDTPVLGIVLVLASLLLGAAVAVGVSRMQARPATSRGADPVAAVVSPPPAPSAEDGAPEIRGHILDADGAPIDEAIVRLVSAGPPCRVYRDTKTDRGGAFAFAYVDRASAAGGTPPPSAVRIVAEHGAEGVVTSAVLSTGEPRSIDLTLVLSGAAVRGTVVDVQGAPIAGAEIAAEGIPWTVRAASDATGGFRLTTVPDLATGLVAAANGYESARASLAGRKDGMDLIVRMVLTAASPVDGEVDDDEGNPVSARVVACEGQPSEVKVQSGADGSFQLPPSAIGCDAVAEHAELASSDPVRVAEGARLTLRLKAGAAIEGVVVDERGAALSPFRVGIESFVPDRGKSFDHGGPRSFDDPSGAFRWDKLAPGTYVLIASASGRPPARSEPVAVRSGAVTTVRIVLARGGTIEGTVTDESRAPIPGVELRFDAVSRVLDSDAAAKTDDFGRYRLEGAPSGLLTIRARKDGFVGRLVSGVSVESGATRKQDITLVAFDGGPTIQLSGIGAALAQNADGLKVQNVFADDPAARAGLHAGDRIVSIDGEPVDGMSLAEALQHIRGVPGTSVGLSVQRSDTGDVVDRTIVRAMVMH